MIKATAIILAGGKSQRMGYKNKALLELGGKPFIEIMIDKVRDFDEIMIVGKDYNQYMYPNVVYVKDRVENHGPLAGIYSGLEAAKNEVCLVIPCDTPYLQEELLKKMVFICKKYEAVVPKNDRYFQPLCACYKKSNIRLIKEAIKNGVTKPIDLYPMMNIYYMSNEEIQTFGEYEVIFKNINTINQYKELEKI